MAIHWKAEACDLAPDPVSGAAICRLTSSAMHSIDIYFEQPHATPDGKRIGYLRAAHADPRHPPTELCVADLERLRIASIDTDIASSWIATAPWRGQLFYLRHNGELICVDLSTLEKRIVLTHWPLPPAMTLWSVTPDLRYLLTVRSDDDGRSELMRVDLRHGACQVIFRCPDVLNHVQIDPVTGRDILIQRNRGLRIDAAGKRRSQPVEHHGATHFLLDLDGGNERTLQIGEPYTAPSTGHATWVGDTGRIATPVHWPGQSVAFGGRAHTPAHDSRHRRGNMIAVGPGEAPIVFPAPEHLFNHASCSRCGRYFVAESLRHGIPGPVEIVVGAWSTGRVATLVGDCGSSCGGPACSHVHAYFTADNRHVIYNADPFGIGQIYKARLPEGFLDALDGSARRDNP